MGGSNLNALLILLLLMFITLIMVLDMTKKISLTNKKVMSIYLIIAPHIILLTFIVNQLADTSGISRGIRIILIIELWIIVLYIWLRLNIFPILNDKSGNTRLIIMMGGRRIIQCGLYALIVQIMLGIYLLDNSKVNYLGNELLIMDISFAVINTLNLLLNGILRIMFTSKRLGIVKRAILLFTGWVPILNIIVILYACRIVRLEYDHHCYKLINENERVDSQVCATKYPLIMVHGIGFRDIKYINYWGRIPKVLIKNGAKIYYGNQEAWGTVEDNARDIKEEIFKILKENNCDKVNIIAHSKGGLDARYMLSELGMGKYVASLTMISSPHKGSPLLDVLCKLPDSAYRKLCNIIDKYFSKVGDKNPDSYTSSRQLATAYAVKFNERIKDVPSVYYQSYTSVMKNCFSHILLTIPYLIMKPIEGENDGLVGIESAKWGNFKGVIRNKHMRGISHADIIDLKREDYNGFDVLEKHIKIVSELKKMGY